MYLLMAVAEVYPDKYLDYLHAWSVEVITEGTEFLSLYRQFDMEIMKIFAKMEELYDGNEIVFHRLISKDYQVDLAYAKFNSTIVSFPSSPFETELCCDFFQCLKTRWSGTMDGPNILNQYKSLKDWLKSKTSCIICLADPTHLSCLVCAGSLLADSEKLIKLLKDCQSKEEVCYGGVLKCEENGAPDKDYFCNTNMDFLIDSLVSGNSFFPIIVSECLECPHVENNSFGIDVTIPFTTSSAIPTPNFRYDLYKNGNLISSANPISTTTSFDFESFSPVVGDILCMDFSAVGCPNYDLVCFPYQGGCANSTLHFPVPQLKEPTSCGSCDGYIGLTKGSWGGSPPIKVTANGVPINKYGSFKDLCPGEYELIATDADNCSVTFNIDFEDEKSPEVREEIINTCEGASNGQIVVFTDLVNNSIKWDDNVNSFDCISIGCELTNLAEGTYCATITNRNNGCSTEECYDIIGFSSSSALGITIFSDKIKKTCPQYTTGGFFYEASGGVAPYHYELVDNGYGHANGGYAYGLPKGDNCITVTDFCGDSATDCIYIEATDPIEYTVIVKPSCTKGDKDFETGSIEITGDYKLTFENGSNGHGLTEGIYVITVQDKDDCTMQESVRVGTTEVTNCRPSPEDCEIEICDCDGESMEVGTLPTHTGPDLINCWEESLYCENGKFIKKTGNSVPVVAQRGCNCSLEVYCTYDGVKTNLMTWTGNVTTETASALSGDGSIDKPYNLMRTRFCNIAVKDILGNNYRYRLNSINLAKHGPGAPKANDAEVCTYRIYGDLNSDGSWSEPEPSAIRDATCEVDFPFKLSAGIPCSDPLPPLVFDWIKQRIQTISDFQGSEDEQLREVLNSSNKKDSEIVLFPNPTNSTINVKYENSDYIDSNYIIYNAQGQVVHKGQIVAKNTKIDFNIKRTSGLFYISVLKQGEIIFGSKIIYTE